jgi:hypothetical protein
MKRSHTAVLLSFSSLLAAPLLAQTTIGGGTCSSQSVNGVYAVQITARGVNSSGTFTNVFQSNGTATFDGLSKVTFSLRQDTGQAVGTPVTWSGTYSIQANCEGTITIASGGNATFNVVLYGGSNGSSPTFLLTGSDATYSYSGSGNTQPLSTQAACSTSNLSGVYTFSATGFVLTSNSVSGVEDGAGLLQFDGQGNLTANVTAYTSGTTTPTALALTGSYSMASNCVGSATLSDSKGNSYSMTFSAYTATASYTSEFYASLAEPSKFIITGAGHAIYGQPTTTAASISGGRS